MTEQQFISAEEFREFARKVLVQVGLSRDDVGDVVEPLVYASFCLLYTSPSPRDGLLSRMPSSA